MSQSAYPDLDQVRWLPALNISGADIPPFGVVRLVSMNTDGQFEVDYPDQDSYPFGLAFNGPTTIPDGGAGSVTTDLPFWGHYDPSTGSGSGTAGEDNVPVAGEIWGPEAGSFALAGDQTGFKVLTSNDPFDLDAMMVVMDPFALGEGADYNGSGSGTGLESGGNGSGGGNGCDASGSGAAGAGITIPFAACDVDGNPCTKELVITLPVPAIWCITDPNGCEG